MIITLDNAYQSELLLLPARNSAGELKGLEILVNFTGVDSDVRIPTELVIPRLSAAEELALFNEKLQLLDTCKLFFIQHQLIAWINITPAIVEFLLSNGNAVSILERYPFLEFTVNENYPGLNNGKDDLQLVSGIDDHGLLQRVLSFNFGAMQGTLWPAVSAEHVTTLVQQR